MIGDVCVFSVIVFAKFGTGLGLADARVRRLTMADEIQIGGADIDVGGGRGSRKVSQVTNCSSSVIQARIMRVGWSSMFGKHSKQWDWPLVHIRFFGKGA